MELENREVSFEEAKDLGIRDLTDVLNEEAAINKISNLYLLKESRFYMNGDNLREHIATYKNYAILLKQEILKQDSGNKMVTLFPSLVHLSDLKKIKKVNRNKVRKMNPQTLLLKEKLSLMYETIKHIDNIRN